MQLGFTGAYRQFRDGLMWMFKNSDKFNRYATGGAALRKWGAGVKQVPEIINGKSISKFMKASGSNQRREWIADEIFAALKGGNLAKAEKLFVRDAVATTQFLYGITDSPLISQVGGFYGRTGTIFQSWWMNYGDMVGRWVTTGEMTERASRLIPWMLSSAIVSQTMSPFWGDATAGRTTGLGPFPSNMIIPPSWEPVSKVIKAVADLSTWEAEKAAEHGIEFLDDLVKFIPAGLQGQMMWRAGQKGGVEELMKSIFKLK